MASANVVTLPEIYPYEECWGSPTESIADDGAFSASRTIKCSWADRLKVVEQFRVGYQVQVGGLSINYPRQYPHQTGVYVSTIAIANLNGDGDEEGTGSSTRTTSYEFAQLTIGYEPKEFDPSAAGGGDVVQIAEESLSIGGQFLSISDGKNLWLAGATEAEVCPEGSFPGIYAPLIQWNYSLESVNLIPNGWAIYEGYVNSGAVTSNSLGITFPAETLLYEGVELNRAITSQGAKTWKASLKFSCRPTGWNKFPKIGIDGTTWEYFYSVPVADGQNGTTIRKPFSSTNFVTNLNLVL